MSTSQAPTAFGAGSTALEVIDGVDLHGRRAVVTGAGSGIGVETVRALATAGADVTLAVRNADTGATHGIAPYALDPENAARLWTVSEALTR
jgi:NAD(P)-dependent dehydrogenase (short-subunit alcohol dehydrogenase family)